jgi:phage shock protein A
MDESYKTPPGLSLPTPCHRVNGAIESAWRFAVQDDFDLEGLSKDEARRYVMGFMQSLQLARRQRAEREAEFEKWKSRTKLAADRSETELARQALARAEELQTSVASLRSEERELEFKVEELKRRLSKLQREPELSVDADALLEQLRTVVGDDQETNEAIAETEAEIALDDLRRRMADESDERDATR